jgi:4'-phosphopantetheinyl transferase
VSEPLVSFRGHLARAPESSEPGLLRLAPNEVQLWSATLDQPVGVVGELRRLLSGDEVARARRFRFERDRNRFVVGRAVLRLLLGRYLEQPPDTIRFSYSAHGKPDLTDFSGKVMFNLSHSEDLALYAFCLDVEIGVDVERFRRRHAREDVAERFFSPSEVAVLRSLPPPGRPEAFLRCWTRKEAFVKARGDGLSLPLDQFDVTLAPGEPARLLRTAWAPEEAASWSLHDPSADLPGYIAAVAVRPVEAARAPVVTSAG